MATDLCGLTCEVYTDLCELTCEVDSDFTTYNSNHHYIQFLYNYSLALVIIALAICH